MSAVCARRRPPRAACSRPAHRSFIECGNRSVLRAGVLTGDLRHHPTFSLTSPATGDRQTAHKSAKLLACDEPEMYPCARCARSACGQTACILGQADWDQLSSVSLLSPQCRTCIADSLSAGIPSSPCTRRAIARLEHVRRALNHDGCCPHNYRRLDWRDDLAAQPQRAIRKSGDAASAPAFERSCASSSPETPTR